MSWYLAAYVLCGGLVCLWLLRTTTRVDAPFVFLSALIWPAVVGLLMIHGLVKMMYWCWDVLHAGEAQ